MTTSTHDGTNAVVIAGPASEPPTIVSRSLVKKLAEVMLAVERVPKRGRNEFHRYDYATEADIVATVRAELAERHVMLIPSAVGYDTKDLGQKKDGTSRGYLLMLNMDLTFHDGESGEQLTVHWLGAGEDSGDKALYKAMTGAVKYALLKTFLMPTGDDPETEGKREARKAERAADSEARAQQRADSKAATFITQDERRTLQKVATDNGWPMTDVKRLIQGYGFASSSAVTKDKFPLIVDALKNGATVPHATAVGVMAPEDALPI